MLTRRTLLGTGLLLQAALALPACGGGDPGTAPDRRETATPQAAPRPAWHLEGDSYVAPRGKTHFLGHFIEQVLGETVENSAVSGASFRQIGDRILAATDLRANPLLIWDGAAVGRTLGSIDMELGVVDEIVRFKAPHRNWLLIPSVVTREQPNAAQVCKDMAALRDALASDYGPIHVFDALPVLQGLANGTESDRADVSAGLVPGSVLIDGRHLGDAGLAAVVNALTRAGGPMVAVRDL
ncbi:hypothetical protein [Sphingomonas sanxanigenens]|uniref:SGNH hydrolase-type esterase domain-containing protein n=1 Tax=Sphingomonas sanxanigenens DSM 19645 = NX02 TaxID=1123269 RepID=W0A8H5_9SPHN|nr:hypothetical protein [Sphingomonas sanxanigenens]AHE54229.1 hypothetical protein NX02_12655 [Sphingomonas sanxanigenens DSM 19645 = NX02]